MRMNRRRKKTSELERLMSSHPVIKLEKSEPSFPADYPVMKSSCEVLHDTVLKLEKSESSAPDKYNLGMQQLYEPPLTAKITSSRPVEKSKPILSCQCCEFVCKTVGVLHRHAVKNHLNIEEKMKLMKSCPIKNCQYKTPESYYLRAHVEKTHSNDKPYKCSKCSFACKRSFNLKTHMLVHTSGAARKKLLKVCPFPDCNYETVYPTNLKHHLVKHSEVKSFKFRHVARHAIKKKLKRKKRSPGGSTKPSQIHSEEFNSESKQMHSAEFKVESNQIGFEEFKIKSEQIHSDEFNIESNQNLSVEFNIESFSPITVEENKMMKLKLKQKIESMELLIQNCRRKNKRAVKKTFLHRVKGTKVPSETAECKSKNDLKMQFSCKNCDYRTPFNELVALHNEQVHSVPTVVLRFAKNL